MLALLAILVFAGAIGLAVGVIVATVAPQVDRIARVLAGGSAGAPRLSTRRPGIGA